jgi:acetyl esterase/lipase
MAVPDNDGDRLLSHAPPRADARIVYGRDPNQFGELRLPKSKPKAPLLLFIHGGYWRARYDLKHAGHLCTALARAGIATLNLEYRRVGNTGGGWPGTFEDIAAARQYLAQNTKELAGKFSVDVSKLMVAGHSAGGALALWLAAREPNITTVASLAGVNDLRRAWELHLSHDAVVELLGGTPQQVPEHYAEADPMRLAIKPRQLLIRGAEDSIVPLEFSSGYAKTKQARGERADLLEIKGAGHFDLIDPESPHWPKVQAALLDLFG